MDCYCDFGSVHQLGVGDHRAADSGDLDSAENKIVADFDCDSAHQIGVGYHRVVYQNVPDTNLAAKEMMVDFDCACFHQIGVVDHHVANRYHAYFDH
jgi:hypothetical protein